MSLKFPHATSMAAACFLLSGACAPAQSASDGQLFGKLAGSWSGTGTVAGDGGAEERLRCRANYSPSSPVQLRLSFRCASDAFNLQIVSDIRRDGDMISGSWSESSNGVSGEISGNAGTDRIEASTEGLGFSARLTIALRGNVQSVQLTSQGQTASKALVTLKRE